MTLHPVPAELDIDTAIADVLDTFDVPWEFDRECIVVPHQDYPTLWECECPECRRLQRQAELDD